MTSTQAPPRLEVRLKSRQALKDAMTYRRMTVRTLSVACGRDSYKSTIGNLTSGFRNTCSPHLAARIEEALALYPGALFAVQVTTGNLDIPAPRKARRAA